MTPKTQERILKALRQTLADLDHWLKVNGWTEAEIIPVYAAMIKENGMMARFVANLTAKALPLSAKISVKPEALVVELRRARSGEFAEWLLSQPEPSPDSLIAIEANMKNGLANLRQHYLDAAKGGPRHRRGGRPEELDDPETRKEICGKINALHGPGTKLEDIFKRVASEYKSRHSAHNKPVSPSKIKRIWLECKDKDKEGENPQSRLD